jgi:hypothetical protein
MEVAKPMSIVFYLAADCGSLRGDAERFSSYFDGFKIIIPDAPETHCETYEIKAALGHWWSLVIPVGVSIGGSDGDIPEFYPKEKMTQIGFLLYDRLKTAPPFRYAHVGIDVSYGYPIEVLIEKNQVGGGSRGIVVAEEIASMLISNGNIEPFSPNYVWIPYQGEFYDLA